MKNALKIALVYVIFSICYIVVSDKLVFNQVFASDIVNEMEKIQTIKGIIFVLASGFILYFVTFRTIKKVEFEQHKFRLLVENTPAAIYIISFEGKVQYCNNLAVELFGYEKDELTTLQEFIPKLFPDEEDRDWVMDFYQKIFDPLQLLPEIDFPMVRTKDGHPKYVKIKTSPYMNQSFILTAEDITSQKLASITLQENQKRLEKVFNTIEDMIIEVKDENGEFIINHVNYSFLKKIGRSRFAIIDHKIDGILGNCTSIDSFLSKAVLEQKTINFDCQLALNGETRYWEFYASPIFDMEEKLSRIVISVRDLTDRISKEIAIKNSEEKFRFLCNIASDAVFEYDINSNYVEWYDEFYSLFGYKDHEIEHTADWINSKIHLSDRRRLKDSVEDAFNQRKDTWVGEYRMKCKNGEYKDVIAKAHIFYSKEGKPKKAVGVIVDYSNKQQAEEMRISALVEGADNERKIFARELHDNLGQNLTFVSMLLEQVKTGYESQVIQRASQLLNKAIEETRNLSHLLMPKVVHEYGLKAAILSQIETLQMSDKYDLSTHFNFNGERLLAKIENNIYSIFQEIVTNIIKHADAHSIQIQLIKSDNSISLSVEDDGVGFDTEYAFSHGGLGLKNMENRVYLLKGFLIIESAPNKGTFINIEVPLI
jgi:PAS domain S-box-containing protein